MRKRKRNPLGTPKSMTQAIKNGIDEGNIEPHVMDFIAQKLQWALLKAHGINKEAEELIKELGRRIGFQIK